MTDNVVASITTYSRRSLLGFLYGGPFAVLYGLWLYYWFAQLGIDDYWEFGCIITAIIGLLQVCNLKIVIFYSKIECCLGFDSLILLLVCRSELYFYVQL